MNNEPSIPIISIRKLSGLYIIILHKRGPNRAVNIDEKKRGGRSLRDSQNIHTLYMRLNRTDVGSILSYTSAGDSVALALAFN